ncbi:cytochrome c3 family protein [bacterium]|nr:cytochrome c3 family protein [bacterium]
MLAGDCSDCHENKVLEKSVHAGFSCSDCHREVGDEHSEKGVPKVSCNSCHEDVYEKWKDSVHSSTELTGTYSATCTDCHGTHEIIAVNKMDAENFCVVCHRKPEVLNLLGIRGSGPVEGYHNSIHNKIKRTDPSKGAPDCYDCHGSHTVYRMSDYRSSYNTLNIPGTCGSCHPKAKEEYEKSIHWRAAKRGHFESPVCNDCHGEHGIKMLDKKASVASHINLASQVCASCHSSDVMMNRFGLDTRRFESYMKTYHGLASIRGSLNAANCVSCHEVHAIRAQNDPQSSVYTGNLRGTCGKCHGKVSQQFATTVMHPVDIKDRNPFAYYVKVFYIVLIILVIGGMLLHNLNEVLYYVRKKQVELKKEETVRRFRKFEVWQHALLMISFILLVITGFALKYPESILVKWMHISEGYRSLIHRTAAVVLVVISFIQAIYLLFHKQGRKDLIALMPDISDFKAFWQSVKFHLGVCEERPKFGRWSYVEKAEYLALIWGTIIMFLSGIILWFPELYMNILPSWTFEVAEVIHFYEAILATLAIFIWHFFFVIFHPEKYPMDLTWIHGRITKKEKEIFHPLEKTEE